jgi:imidazole glycerol-phosphate synthase subunit HisF
MIRIVARLDVKNETVVKGIQMDGLRVVGNPYDLASSYYQQGIDEIVYVDAVASLYERNSLYDLVSKSCQNVFVPMTVGGGLRSVDDVARMFRSGADKVTINTACINRPELISEVAQKFGSQAITVSVQAKKRSADSWEAFTEAGREPTGRDVLTWINEAMDLGAGEIFLTSIDKDGTKKGFDLELIEKAADICRVPLMVCGGAGKIEHVMDAAKIPGVDAIALGSALHYNLISIDQVKTALANEGIEVRAKFDA